MSSLDEFIEASAPATPRCGVAKILVFLDDADPDRAKVLRAAIVERGRVTAPAIARVVHGWELEGAPEVTAQTYQRHRTGACSCGD